MGSKSSKPSGKSDKKSKRNNRQQPARTLPTYDEPAAPMMKKREFTAQLLEIQNTHRRRHGSPDLILDSELCEGAQRWADYIATTGKLQPTSDKLVGENSAWSISNRTPQQITAMWYNESRHYNYTRPGLTPATKNFTQLVWKDSTKFGVGVAYDEAGSMYVVGRYSPPGNISKPGYYDNNVKQPATV